MDTEKWNSRKFFAAAATEVLATALLWFGKIPAQTWEMVTMACVVGYILGQAYVDKRPS